MNELLIVVSVALLLQAVAIFVAVLLLQWFGFLPKPKWIEKLKERFEKWMKY